MSKKARQACEESNVEDRARSAAAEICKTPYRLHSICANGAARI